MEILFALLINAVIAAIIVLAAVLSFNYAFWWWVRGNRAGWLAHLYYKKQIVLEIKLPKEINKSPAAFELVLNGAFQVGDLDTTLSGLGKVHGFSDLLHKPFKTFEGIRKWWTDEAKGGKTPTWMSFEIASIGGELHFYIVCVEKFKQIMESYIYSQYPGVEITQVEDYLNDVRPEWHFPGSGYELYTSGVYATAKPDYLPIKTYMDYGMDKDPKEEYKIDPLTPLLESMANIGPDERVYYQVLAVATRDKNWTKPGKARIDNILGIKRDHDGNVLSQARTNMQLTIKEKEEIERIQRNIEKPGFDCNIKVIYASKDKKNGPAGQSFKNNNDQIVRNSMKSFESKEFNSFKLEHQNASFPWMDYADQRRMRRRRAGWFYLLERRTWFYPEVDIDSSPTKVAFQRLREFGWYEFWAYINGDMFDYYKPNSWEERPTFTLNTEELATIYHFPGQVLNAPKVSRVEAEKSNAPVNLPV
jgi:hypothetical protein